MKKIVLTLAVLASGALLPAQAPTPFPAPAPAPPSYSVTTDFTYTTKYVFRGVELAKGAYQPSAKLTVGDFYASLWASAPVRGYELEIDYAAGYGFKLSDAWNIDTGLTAYTYPNLDTRGGADKATFEPFVGLNGTFGVLTTATYVYYDFTLKAFTLQEALGYSTAISDNVSANILATAGHVSPDVGSGYTYYGVSVTVPYKLSDRATVTAGIQYASHNLSGVAGDHFWGTLGFTYIF